MPFLKGVRFLKRIPIWKLVTLNLSKHGLGISFGKRGIRFGRSATGKLYIWLGVPGTGLGYRKYVDPKRVISWLLGAWQLFGQADTTADERQEHQRGPRLSGYMKRYEAWYRNPITRRNIKRAKEILRDEYERKRREQTEPQAESGTDL